MTAWTQTRLEDVCKHVTVGFVGSMAHEYCVEGVPFLRSQNIRPFRLHLDDIKFIPPSFHERIGKSALRPGDVAIVRTGYPGTAAVIPNDLPESNCSDLVIVRPGPNLNPHFLAAIFNSTFGQQLVGGNLVGAAQQHFNITVAKQLKLMLPPRKTQDKIAAIFVAFDDMIANNQRRIALLESMAEEIYREWFVRLRFPGSKSTKVSNGRPEGWTEVRVGQVAKVNEKSLSRASITETIRYIDISAVGTNTMNDPTEMSLSNAPGRARRIVRHGDILWSSVRPGNRSYCLVLEPAPSLVASSGFAVISPMQGTPYTYLYRTLTTDNFVEQMVNVAKGSAYPATGFDDFEKARIVWPDSGLLLRFHDVCEPMHAEAQLLKQQCQSLRAQRDALLPRLISGKLRVDHLDIRLPPSMQDAA